MRETGPSGCQGNGLNQGGPKCWLKGGGGGRRAAKRRDRTQWSESCQNQAGEEELGLSLSGQ